MKAFLTRTAGGIDDLTLENIPEPGALCSGQIRIAMRAASLNYRDLMAVTGAFGSPGEQGLIPCSDGTGEVVETGPDVTRVRTGDRVALTFNPDWIGGPWRASAAAMGRGGPLMQGVMREQIVVHASEVVTLPPQLDFDEGAALPCAGVTAWHALCGPAPLFPGMTVLLQGTGGVSTLGIQFAKLFGARVIATTSTPERQRLLERLGADATINYREKPAWDERVRELTGGEGVDLCVEIGGAETVDRSLAATRTGGRVALVGLLSGWPNAVSSMFSSGVDITPIKVGSRDDFERMLRAMALHDVHPLIDSRFTFDQLPDALRHLESKGHTGKIVLNF